MTDKDYIEGSNLAQKDYIGTFTGFMTNLQIPEGMRDFWTVRIYPWDIYKGLHLKWYKRIYRRVFPIRAYVNWRSKQYFFRINHAKMMLKIDEFICWGDAISHDR